MLNISPEITISDSEIELSAIRAEGPGGQNVNKVSTAIHLRFDINASSLPDEYKFKLLHFHDHRISSQGFIIIKAQAYRSQEKNKIDALERLHRLIIKAITVQKPRKKTKPSKLSVKRRLDNKIRRGKLKKLRQLSP